jgi:hypothetical protein
MKDVKFCALYVKDQMCETIEKCSYKYTATISAHSDNFLYTCQNKPCNGWKLHDTFAYQYDTIDNQLVETGKVQNYDNNTNIVIGMLVLLFGLSMIGFVCKHYNQSDGFTSL